MVSRGLSSINHYSFLRPTMVMRMKALMVQTLRDGRGTMVL
jgi:hypothetical protein